MKKFRIVRDVSLLLFGGFLLFGAVTLVNMFGGNQDLEQRSEFSNARRVAELSVKREDWKAVVASNQKLIQQDPFNSHAWYAKATASFRITTEDREAVSALETAQADEQQITEAKAKLTESAKMARDNFVSCLDYVRYRNTARIYLASLESTLGNKPVAMNHLKEALEDGFYSRQYRIGNFQSLRNEDGFAELLAMESKNRALRPDMRKRPQVRRGN
jgi:hypothetical protein